MENGDKSKYINFSNYICTSFEWEQIGSILNITAPPKNKIWNFWRNSTFWVILESLLQLKFSVAKATLHSQMSVRLSVRPSGSKTPQQLKSFIFHHTTFIFHHSSFILHSSFIIPHSSFLISRLLSFSACLCITPKYYFVSKWRLQ